MWECVGLFVVSSCSVSDSDDFESGEDDEGEEEDVEFDGALEELSTESGLEWLADLRMARPAHSWQNSPGCEVTPTMHLS